MNKKATLDPKLTLSLIFKSGQTSTISSIFQLGVQPLPSLMEEGVDFTYKEDLIEPYVIKNGSMPSTWFPAQLSQNSDLTTFLYF
jgi:hypothetical protein